MLAQHMACVTVMVSVLEALGRKVETGEDFVVRSEKLTLTSARVEQTRRHGVVIPGEFNKDGEKNSQGVRKLGQESATLIMQTWLMIAFLIKDDDVVFPDVVTFWGGQDVNNTLSPSSEFVKDVLAKLFDLSDVVVKLTQTKDKIGKLSFNPSRAFAGMSTTTRFSVESDKRLLDQIICMVAGLVADSAGSAADSAGSADSCECVIEFVGEPTSHAMSQMYIWATLLGVTFEMSGPTPTGENTPLPILDETVDTIYGLYLMSTVFLGASSQLAVRPAFPRNDAGCIYPIHCA